MQSTKKHSPLRSARTAFGVSLSLAVALALGGPALASHPEASLPGSNFEIDVNANLKRDDPAPSIDWASVTETRNNDLASGQNDDSYSGGAKEDDPCPGTTTGSIPNNKSDLLTFGAYVEPGATAGDPGFLNLFWTRVQEPSGTTLMDFELNQSSTPCGNGVNPLRTAGDLLLEYRLEQGGAVATIKVREWSGTAWGNAVDLTGTAAVGTINSTAIPVAESDGLSTTNPISPRTFGEAQLDLDFILDANKCESFGSAFIKSRSSDSFTSQLKDFIKPVPVNITNCGKVIIRKETDPDDPSGDPQFGFTKTLATDPPSANTFFLGDGDSKTFTGVLFGSNYTVTEDSPPVPWEFVDVDCSASTGVTPTINGELVTFDIDNATDVLDCTYTNRARGALVIQKTRKHAADGPGDHPHAGVDFDIVGPDVVTTETTGAAGDICLENMATGDYTVTEVVPGGYVAEGSDEQVVTVVAGTTCATAEAAEFHNLPLTDLTCSVDSQVIGGTASKIQCTGENGLVTFTDATGDGSHTLANLEPGTYACTIVIDP